MRYAILSDIHANLTAFEAVLEDMEKRGGVDRLWHLGDTVGYGPEPHECIELLRRYDHLNIGGNHDLAAIGRIGTGEFNADAAEAAQWTAGHLEKSDIEYLGGLPLKADEAGFVMAHGSPREPVWEYIITSTAAAVSFSYFSTRCCLVGHSHIALVYTQEEDGACAGKRFLSEIDVSGEGERMIINPGAVGQPRDGFPEAAYALYDSETGLIRPHRVPYDIPAVQEKMKKLDLPAGLWMRLGLGL